MGSTSAPDGGAPLLVAEKERVDVATMEKRKLAEEKPRMRGVLHEISIWPSAAVTVAMVIVAPGIWPRFACAIYGLCVTGMLSASTLLHRGHWSPNAHRWIQRLDHCMIFLAIAGTYTAVVSLVLSTAWSALILSLVWGGALAGIVIRLSWMHAPRWVVMTPYVVVGWIALVAAPPLWRGLGAAGFVWMLVAGLTYTIGAVVFATKRPNPWPKVFGFHEVFHTCTVIAATIYYVEMFVVVLPRI